MSKNAFIQANTAKELSAMFQAMDALISAVFAAKFQFMINDGSA